MMVTKRPRLVKGTFQHCFHSQQQREENVANHIPSLKASPQKWAMSLTFHWPKYVIWPCLTSKGMGRFSTVMFLPINPLTLDDSWLTSEILITPKLLSLVQTLLLSSDHYVQLPNWPTYTSKSTWPQTEFISAPRSTPSFDFPSLMNETSCLPSQKPGSHPGPILLPHFPHPKVILLVLSPWHLFSHPPSPLHFLILLLLP